MISEKKEQDVELVRIHSLWMDPTPVGNAYFYKRHNKESPLIPWFTASSGSVTRQLGEREVTISLDDPDHIQTRRPLLHRIKQIM